MRSPDLGRIEGLSRRFDREFSLELFRRANYCRQFELHVKEAFDRKLFTIPIYLSLGTEFSAAALSLTMRDALLFGQHRCHSHYLCRGGSPQALRDELLGLPTGCSGGWSGSNAIQSPEADMIGHSGLMGEQVPIAVGAAMASGRRCLTICGDASVEEDYIYPSLGWAASRRFPVLFVCEDNNLSILTEVGVRRTWSPVEVARSVGMDAVDIADDPWLLAHHVLRLRESLPGFINLRCVRVLWHAGTGTDGPPEWDRYSLVVQEMRDELALGAEMDEIERENSRKVEALWQEQLQRR